MLSYNISKSQGKKNSTNKKDPLLHSKIINNFYYFNKFQNKFSKLILRNMKNAEYI